MRLDILTHRANASRPALLTCTITPMAGFAKSPTLRLKRCRGSQQRVIMADGISYAPVDAQTWPHWVYYMRALNGLQLSDYDGWEA